MEGENLSLHRKAKQLTAFLFGECSFPECLSTYAPLFITVGAGASVAIGGTLLYRWACERQRSRKVVQLAVFHVIRLIDVRYRFLLDRYEQDCNSTEVFQVMEAEVNELVRRHVATMDEGAKIMKTLKRELWTSDIGRSEKRLKTGASVQPSNNRQMQASFDKHTIPGQYPIFNSSPGRTYGFEYSFEEEDDDQRTIPGQYPTAETQPEQPVRASSPGRTYGFEYSSEEEDDDQQTIPSEQPVRASSPGRTYGLEYSSDEDEESDEEDEKDQNNGHKVLGAVQQQPQPTTERQSLVQRAIEAAFDPNSPGNLSSMRPKAMKPQSSLPITPPTQLGRICGDQAVGQHLSPIKEGLTKSLSPEMEKTRYRVAETRQFYAGIQSANKSPLRAVVPMQEGRKEENSEVAEGGLGSNMSDPIVLSDYEYSSLESMMSSPMTDAPLPSSPPDAQPLPTWDLDSTPARPTPENTNYRAILRIEKRLSSSPAKSTRSPGALGLASPLGMRKTSSPAEHTRSPKVVGPASLLRTSDAPQAPARGHRRAPSTPLPKRSRALVEVPPSRRSTRKTAYKGPFGK